MKKSKSKFSKYLKYPDGGIIKPPIQTTDPNKVRAYNDSLQLHNLTKGIYDGMLGDMKNGVLPAEKVPYHISKMDEIIPKTDSLVNDLYDMGINYKVKGYNKVPIGSNGNFTEVGKLQKVAPMPKQPYFFKGGGKLNKSELSLTNKENFYNQEIPWNTIAENSLNIGKTSLNYSKNLGGNRKLPSDRDFISLELAGGMDRTQEKKDPWINNSEIINKNSPNLKAGLKYNSDVLDGENKKYTVPIQVEGGVKFADNRLTPYTNFRTGVQRNFMNHQGNKIGSINPYLDLGWGIDGKGYENRLSGTEHINAGIKGELNLNKFGRRNRSDNDLYLSGDISKNGSTGATQAEVGMGYKFKDGGKVYPKNYKPSLSPAPDTINFHALQDRILAKPHKMSAPKITEEQKRLPNFFKGGGKLSYGGSIGTGAASGAAMGATIGSIIPVWGTAAGAVIGGVAGGVGGYFKEKNQQESLERQEDLNTNLNPNFNMNPLGNSFKNGGDLTRFNGAKHEQGGIKINKLGVPVNNPNSAVAEVEGDETMRGDYIYSDTLGVDKKGQVQTNAKKVNKTFADLSKKIDNKFKGRNDEISNVTKNFMYKNLTEKNEIALQSKFQKSFSSFQKKWGGMLNKYPFGGMVGEGLKDYLINNPMSNSAISNLDSYENIDLDQLQENGNNLITPNNLNVNDSLNSRLRGESNMSYLPQNNKLLQSPQAKLNPLNTNPIDAQKMAQDTTEGINYADYISPALNAGFGIYNALKKPNNYLAKPNNQAIEAANQIQTEPDNTQLYNRNERSLRAANKSSGNYSGSLRNSLQANNLGIKLNADNEIAFREQAEKLDRETNKKGAIAQLQDSNNRFRQAAMHTYQNENTQDASKRQDNALGYLGAAVNDISNIGYDKELGKILNEGLKYYSYDSKTGKYMYKNNVGRVFYSTVSPNEVSKKTTE